MSLRIFLIKHYAKGILCIKDILKSLYLTFKFTILQGEIPVNLTTVYYHNEILMCFYKVLWIHNALRMHLYCIIVHVWACVRIFLHYIKINKECAWEIKKSQIHLVLCKFVRASKDECVCVGVKGSMRGYTPCRYIDLHRSLPLDPPHGSFDWLQESSSG